MRFGERHAFRGKLAQARRFDFTQRVQRIDVAVSEIIRQDVDNIGTIVLFGGLNAGLGLAAGENEEANSENIREGDEWFLHTIFSW